MFPSNSKTLPSINRSVPDMPCERYHPLAKTGSNFQYLKSLFVPGCLCLCKYVLYVRMHACMHAWMDGWMDGCMDAA